MPAGFGTHINAYVINARFGTRTLADDLTRGQTNGAKRARPSHASMYTPIHDLKDYTMKRGELVWDRLGPGGNPRLEEAQQPIVRTVINGATYMPKNGDDDIEPFLKDVRVHGLVREDVVFDGDKIGKAPSSDPVIVVAGVQTTYNFGEETIQPGMGLEWYPVKKTHRYQINDGITTFSSPTRYTWGLRHLTLSCNVQAVMEADKGFKKAWTDFLTHVIHIPKDMLAHDDPVWDGVLRALQEPIVEAYENHAGCATTGTGKGKRANMMISAPFTKFKLGNPRPYSVVSAAGGAPPPKAKSVLKRTELFQNLQFPPNAAIASRIEIADIVGEPKNKGYNLQGAYDVLNAVTAAEGLDDGDMKLVKFVEREFEYIRSGKSAVNAGFHTAVALYKISGLFDRLNDIEPDVKKLNYVDPMYKSFGAVIEEGISKSSKLVSADRYKIQPGDEIKFDADGDMIIYPKST